jgi:hypothetical protein
MIRPFITKLGVVMLIALAHRPVMADTWGQKKEAGILSPPPLVELQYRSRNRQDFQIPGGTDHQNYLPSISG